MTKHKYSNTDIVLMKDAVFNLRKVQEQIENDNEAYQAIDKAMCKIEDLIDTAEGEE